ncbi:unnamed protein product, partial [Leptidea sinapis]
REPSDLLYTKFT